MLRRVSLDQTCRAAGPQDRLCGRWFFETPPEPQGAFQIREISDLRKDDLSNALNINQAVHWSMSNCQTVNACVVLCHPFFARFRTDRPRLREEILWEAENS